MKRIRQIIRSMTPPIVFKIYEHLSCNTGFFGNYTTWEEARRASNGYGSEVILNKVKDALLKVKNGEAVYERDSVLFQKIEYSWPLIAALLWIASRNGNRLNVVDFGGSLGSSYFQNRKMLAHLHELEMERGRADKIRRMRNNDFEDQNLKFYYYLEDCLKEQHADTILLSSVIQYLEKPYDLLSDVKRNKVKYVVLDRTAFIDAGDDRITVQKVPPQIYDASYPGWFFNEHKFLDFFSDEYELISDFESNDRANIPSVFKGYIFRLKNAD